MEIGTRPSTPQPYGRGSAHELQDSHPCWPDRPWQEYHPEGKLPDEGHHSLRDISQVRPICADREHYRTVFAREPGSVAAPTAGLHFTPQILEVVAERRGSRASRSTWAWEHLRRCSVERVDEVRLHRSGTHQRLRRRRGEPRRRETRRVVAVGTTVAHADRRRRSTCRGLLQPHSGATEIFISPGFEFRLVNALLTNFHLPQSSLLMLVSAFAGRERVCWPPTSTRSGKATASSAMATACSSPCQEMIQLDDEFFTHAIEAGDLLEGAPLALLCSCP